jgi:hypothetical protein
LIWAFAKIERFIFNFHKDLWRFDWKHVYDGIEWLSLPVDWPRVEIFGSTGRQLMLLMMYVGSLWHWVSSFFSVSIHFHGVLGDDVELLKNERGGLLKNWRIVGKMVCQMLEESSVG